MALNSPILIKNPENIVPFLDPRTFLHVGGIWGQIRSGQTVMATDGMRFVWSADGLQVIYTQKNQFYGQSASGFIGEMRTAPYIEGLRLAEFMARVAEVEMKLMMGVV